LEKAEVKFFSRSSFKIFIALELIQRGGGTGPMKPGNLRDAQGANSCKLLSLIDKEGHCF